MRHDDKCAATTTKTVAPWDNRSAPAGAGNTLRGLTRSSGTSREGLAMKATRTPRRAYRQDFTGQRFGRLTVLQEADPIVRNGERSGGPIRRWTCRCECGGEIVARQTDLRSGRSQTCGCSRKENPGAPRRQSAVGYASAHRRVQRDRGKASIWACVDCNGPAAEWSYDGGDHEELTSIVNNYAMPYSLQPEFYSPRCRSCHRRMDAKRGVANAS